MVEVLKRSNPMILSPDTAQLWHQARTHWNNF